MHWLGDMEIPCWLITNSDGHVHYFPLFDQDKQLRRNMGVNEHERLKK